MYWLEVLIIACGGGAVGCVVFLLVQMAQQAYALHRAAQNEVVVTDTTSGLMRSFLPMARGLGVAVCVLLARGDRSSMYYRLRETIGRRLSAAGNPQGINADEYVGFWGLLSVAGGLAAVMLFLFLEPDTMFSVYVYFGGGVALGFMYWHSWLNRAKASYQNSIRKALPFSLDLLTLSMEAGLDFTSALARMVKKIGNSALGKEFSLMLHEIQLGKSRSQSLRDFANRVDVPEVGTVVASLIQAEELGASLGPILRIQSAQQRERRSQRAEEIAMRAPVKILFPLVVCMFPAIMLILAAPIIISVMRSL